MIRPRTNWFLITPGVLTSARRVRQLPVSFADQVLPVPIPVVVKPGPAISKISIQFPRPFPQYVLVRLCLGSILLAALVTFVANAQTPNASIVGANPSTVSRVIEAAGLVEFNVRASTNWSAATNGLPLQPGDKLRTRAASRAAVQLSDRSVIRLSERTTLEILPPRNAEKKRFGLPAGSIYFFNREQPADVEFDTPLAAGAIRGTEFLLEVANADSAVHLALIDGLVALDTTSGQLDLKRGEALQLTPGQSPQVTALINATANIQWALYYPAVINPPDLQLADAESAALKEVLEYYRSGDLIAALAVWPSGAAIMGAGSSSLRAQLELAVGRVAEAERLLLEVPNDAPAKLALLQLIATVRGDASKSQTVRSRSASEWLARSYSLQGQANLPEALGAAKQAVALAPQSGFAHARLAELEFSFGHHQSTLVELKQAYELSPRLASAYAWQGFTLLEQGQPRLAQVHFDQARELDAAFGPAWLGRGLCLMRERKFPEARAAFQAAAALEPQRGLFRSYLGKAASELGDAKAAEKEFNLAKQLDANDPTAWLYSALHLWQENRLNEAVRDLEASADRNDNRAAFRSRLRLDQDRAVRSANLAALFDEAGIPEASRHASTRALNESYADFSGHLFRADSLAIEESTSRFDLRNETARQSELLVANLLAPPGAGNLSQTLSQQDHLRFFDAKPVGASLLNEYRSNGDWRETGTAFGSVAGFSYALDAVYQSLNGEQPNGQLERHEFALTLKQRLTASDEAYFQIGTYHNRAGDVANYYDPAQAQIDFTIHERQEPTLYAGWHHEWSPGSHTLFLVARLDDSLNFHDPNANAIFLRQTAGTTVEVQSPPTGPAVGLSFASGVKLYSAELQHIWETERHSLIVGGRWQHGDVESRSDLTRVFPLTSDTVNASVERGNAYGYYTLKLMDSLSLVGGATYDRVRFPRNADAAPLSAGQDSRDLVSPKAAILFAPWERGLVRASYTESLGGLYFDNSIRLEPTQVGGFNQAFRSLIPESIAGLVPGTQFETVGVGFDQSLRGGTWFGVEADWLKSDGDRALGVLTNSTFLPIPDSPGSTRQTLEFRERNLTAYVGQLLGDNFSLGARYRLSEAKLTERFPEIPDAAANLNLLESDERAVLHHVSLTANFHHRSGAFAQWESAWYRQNNHGYTPALVNDDLWQHNVSAGYRFPRRQAEIRVGIMNIFSQDYRLNPLNVHEELPRARCFVMTLRLNF